MTNIDELKVLVDSIKEKLDESQSALLSEDLLSIVSNYQILFDELTSIKEEVDKLKSENEELLKVNGRLFQKIGFDEDIKDESAELPESAKEEEISVEEVIDERGEII